MSLLRILLFVGLAAVVYRLLRKASLAMRGPAADAPDDRLNRLEPCAQCGVYVDSKEALHRQIHGESQLFCSDRCVLEAEAASKESARQHQDGSS